MKAETSFIRVPTASLKSLRDFCKLRHKVIGTEAGVAIYEYLKKRRVAAPAGKRGRSSDAPPRKKT